MTDTVTNPPTSPAPTSPSSPSSPSSSSSSSSPSSSGTTSPAVAAAGPDLPLAGRVALVTGASSGIGEAIARRFAGAGARVVAAARRADRLAALAEAVPGVVPVTVDVTDAAALAAAVDRVAAEVGPPDLVVANAGVALPGPVQEVGLGGWQRTIEVNVGGVVATVAAVLPHLVAGAAAGKAADLVLVSSISDTFSMPGFAVYSASKAAVTKLSHDLRLELAPRGVRLLNLRPGLVTTEIQDGVEEPDVQAIFAELLATLTPLSPDDVAAAALAAVALPPHVNVSELTIVPTGQPAAV